MDIVAQRHGTAQHWLGTIMTLQVRPIEKKIFHPEIKVPAMTGDVEND